MKEQQLHRAVADYLRTVLLPPAFFTTFPSGGGGRIRGALLKRLGLLAGMPDILIFARRDLLGIELKTPIGRLSSQQKLVHAAFQASGFSVFVCRSIEDVAVALRLRGIRTRRVPANVLDQQKGGVMRPLAIDLFCGD